MKKTFAVRIIILLYHVDFYGLIVPYHHEKDGQTTSPYHMSEVTNLIFYSIITSLQKRKSIYSTSSCRSSRFLLQKGGKRKGGKKEAHPLYNVKLIYLDACTAINVFKPLQEDRDENFFNSHNAHRLYTVAVRYIFYVTATYKIHFPQTYVALVSGLRRSFA